MKLLKAMLLFLAGSPFAVAQDGETRKPNVILGDWKLILPQRTYFVHDRKVVPDHVVPDKPFELYDLRADPSETTNLAENNPEQLQSVFAALKADIERGRSRPIN